MDVEARIAELRARIREADHLYYDLGTPALADSEYDDLFRELTALEREHPELVTADSPTRRVGAPLRDERATHEHLLPMLSIESLHTADEVREFAARAHKQLALAEGEGLRWAVEPKYDGVSASLLYEDGHLVRALSRGDGARGEDITGNVRTIRSVPERLRGTGPFPPRIEVRGEVIMSRSDFARLQQSAITTTDTQFRNARNTVAGTLKLLDPAIVATRPMDFICWGVGHVEGVDVDTYADLQERLRAFGMRTSEPFAVVAGVDGILGFHADLEARRDDADYEMDGIVAKVDALDLQRRLGRRSRAPRYMLAFKFAPRRGITRVLGITAQVGRTGAVTPVAELEPLELAGVTVRRATLHNWGLLRERDVRRGDTVEVERAGDVIPAVVKVLTEQRPKGSRPEHPPAECPECGTGLEEEGAFLHCTNVECPAQVKGRIVHMASRRALDIDRLGPSYVDQLLGAGLIRAPEDIFTLAAKKDAILALERWGERSYEKLVAEIEKAKRPPFDRFLHALGIRLVGETTARDLAEAFDSLEDLEAADEEQLMQVEGVGEEVAKSIRAFFAVPGNRKFLDAARAAGLRIAQRQRSGGPLAGRVFCFTGGLDRIGRDEARALVEALGGKTSASLTKKVTDVVAGENAGSKAEKAKKLGLAIVDEQEFLELVGRG